MSPEHSYPQVDFALGNLIDKAHDMPEGKPGYFVMATNPLLTLYADNKQVSHQIGCLKSDIMQRMCDKFMDNRPSTSGCPIEEIDEIVENFNAVLYVKLDNSTKKMVWKVTPCSDGWTIAFIDPGKNNDEHPLIVDTTHVARGDLATFFSACSAEGMNDFALIEEAIDITPSANGNTWEMRMTPVEHDEHCALLSMYIKEAQPGSPINNVSHGNAERITDTTDTFLDGVIGRVIVDKSSEAITACRQAFLQESQVLANRVLSELTHHYQNVARSVIDPDLLNKGEDYNAMITECVRSTMCCVDITGVWSADDQTLKPQIIEVQSGADLTDESHRIVKASVGDRHKEYFDDFNRRLRIEPRRIMFPM